MFSRTAIHNRIMDAIHPQLSRAHRLEDDLRKPFHGTGRHRRADDMKETA